MEALSVNMEKLRILPDSLQKLSCLQHQNRTLAPSEPGPRPQSRFPWEGPPRPSMAQAVLAADFPAWTSQAERDRKAASHPAVHQGNPHLLCGIPRDMKLRAAYDTVRYRMCLFIAPNVSAKWCV